MNLENVINQRLKLQTTQRQLAEYGIELSSAQGLKSARFAKTWNKLEEKQQWSLINIIGGYANRKITTEYLREILEGVTA